MRNFNRRTIILFIIFIAVVSIGLGVLYFGISTNYMNSKASEQLSSVNKSLSLSVEVNIENDYNYLKNTVDDLIEKGTDPKILLNNSSDTTFNLNGLPVFRWGTIANDGNFLLSTIQVLRFTDQGKEAYFSSATVFSYRDAFMNPIIVDQDVKQLVFRFNDNLFITYNALDYFSKIFIQTENSLQYTYYLVGSDLQLYMHNNALTVINNEAIRYFDAYMNASDTYVANLAANLKNPDTQNNVSVANFKGVSSYIVRHVVDIPPFTDQRTENENYQLFVFTVYNESDLNVDLSMLAVVLIVIFVVVVAINALLVFYTIRSVKKKTESAEGAKNNYLKQLKTYSIEINNAGTIKGFNDTFRDEFTNFDEYKNFRDLDFVSDLGPDILLSRKDSFVAGFTKGGQKFYLKFEFVKTMFRTVLVGLDVTKLVSSLEESQKLAYRNQVSGLPNKNSLMKALTELFAQPGFLERHNSLVAVNITKFRNVNQIVGTRIADTIIFDLGQEIQESLKANNFHFQVFNTVADNFICLLEHVKTYDDVVKWVENFLDGRKKSKKGNTVLDIELKIGIFHLARNEEYSVLTVDEAYESVMEALNAAKDSSSNKAVFDSRLGQVSSRRKLMELDLIEAVKKEEFVMYLQPQLSASTNKIVGFEALIRWDNPKYINESPQRFIEIAESNGLIIDIGRIVIKKTFALAKELSDYDICISMNVSPVQILQAGFATEMIEELKKNELRPGQISLEITETFLITSFDLIINKVKILRDHGIIIHLDDFGTGYSSLLYLKELPINTIKIDRGFVQHLENDKYSKSIVAFICNLGKNLDYDIIAEGVERQTQVALLSKYGADIIQGYLISKPVPKAEAIKLLEQYNK